MIITSTQNARVKRLLALQQKSSLRRQQQTIVVEGQREVRHCVEAGFEMLALYHCPSIAGPIDVRQYGCPAFELTPQVYARVAYRGGTEGILAEVRPRQLTLSDLQPGPDALLVVLEQVEKPGNLGAVLRSADAARATAVIVCDALTDLYNPNVIRTSLGAVFTVPCLTCTSAQCIDFLRTHDIRIVTAQLQDSQPYYHTDMRGATAIVMGTESTGLTAVWRESADAHVLIPMQGRLDSLNVSVSAAVLLFEAVRQRACHNS